MFSALHPSTLILVTLAIVAGVIKVVAGIFNYWEARALISEEPHVKIAFGDVTFILVVAAILQAVIDIFGGTC